MLKFVVNGENIFNPIENKIPNFIEAFVDVFGEKYRDKITDNLSSALYFFPIANDTELNSRFITYKKQELATCKTAEQQNQIEEKYNKFFNALSRHEIHNLNLMLKHKEQRLEYLKNLILDILCANGKSTQISDEKMKFLTNTYDTLLSLSIPKLQARLKFSPDVVLEDAENFFLELGFKNQNSFEEYAQNEQIQELVFNSTIIETFSLMVENQDIEKFNSNIFAKNILKRLNSLNLYNSKQWHQELLSYMQNESGSVAFEANEFDCNGNMQALLFCSNRTENNFHSLLHEMGHIVDVSYVKLNQNEFYVKEGILCSIKTLLPDNTTTSACISYLKKTTLTRRDYYIFNEILNDYLTWKVQQAFNQRNYQINFGKDNNGFLPTYCFGFEILSEFFEHHLEKLIDFKMDVNFEHSLEYFGTENLVKIMSICDKYIKQRLSTTSSCKTLAEGKQKDQNFISKTKSIIDKIDQEIILRNKKRTQTKELAQCNEPII